MKSKKFNKDLLNEEVNKFKALSEYAFYEDRPGDDEEEINDLLLGTVSEEEEAGLDIPDEDIEIPGEEAEEAEGEETEADANADDSGEEEAGEEEEVDFGGEDAFGDEEMAPEEPEDDAIELDVTELVKGSEEAKASADAANAKIDQLMGMVDKLEGQLSSMSTISNKIDDLENELEKRAPTPEEKIEMRSLDSYPYNIKLSDFWSEQEGQYDVMSDKEKEYVLDKKAIDSDYSDTEIKDTFDADNEYEEEDI